MKLALNILRLLLLNVPGAISFSSLRTVSGITYSTFKEDAIAHNLVETDDEWEHCLDEACCSQFPYALCQLFAFICIFHNQSHKR